MIVVDVNLLVGELLRDDASAHAVMARDSVWLAPPLWRSEFRNVLAGFIRREGLLLPQASRAYVQAEEVLGEVTPDPEHVLRLVTESNCTAYDLEYVAVAMARSIPLVTLDRQVLAAFPGVAVTPGEFAP